MVNTLTMVIFCEKKEKEKFYLCVPNIFIIFAQFFRFQNLKELYMFFSQNFKKQSCEGN